VKMMMLSSVHTRGTNMFHPLQDNPENNEQEEDEKAEGGRGYGDETGLANVSWPLSDDEQSIDPILHTLTTSMDALASAPPPTFSTPSFTFSAPSRGTPRSDVHALMKRVASEDTPSVPLRKY
jgi:hypothetical protein